MKRILNIIKQDLTSSGRDMILLYSILSPIIVAIAIAMFLPQAQGAQITLAAHSNVGSEVIGTLEEYGKVVVFDSREELEKRILNVDDVPGIISENGQLKVILEGNEGLKSREIFTTILARALSSEPGVEFDHVRMQDTRDYTREYIGVIMLMFATLVGGMAVGFTIVNDRDTKVINAFSVSPTRLIEYLLARGVFSTFIGVIAGMLVTVIILGFQVNYLLLLLGIIISGGISVTLGYLLGAFAANQITAIALVKLLMPVYLTVPIVSIVVPQEWHWLFFIFPNYWMFIMFENLILTDIGQVLTFWPAAGLTFIGSIGLVLALMPVYKKKFKLR